jgi:hypothetical protein
MGATLPIGCKCEEKTLDDNSDLIQLIEAKPMLIGGAKMEQSIAQIRKVDGVDFLGDHPLPRVQNFCDEDIMKNLPQSMQKDLFRIFGFTKEAIDATATGKNGGFACAVADPMSRECPLIFVSQGFESLTGYPANFSVGRSCRFLQPRLGVMNEAFNKLEKNRMKDFCKAPEPQGTVIINLLLNERLDGSRFWNLLRMEHVEVMGHSYILGVQTNLETYIPKALRQRNDEKAWNFKLLSALTDYVDDIESVREALAKRTDLTMIDLKTLGERLMADLKYPVSATKPGESRLTRLGQISYEFDTKGGRPEEVEIAGLAQQAEDALQKEYGLFLSHHKLSSGLICRQLKLMLDARSKEGIFFDVDSLENTSTLLETVKSKIKTLVLVEAGDVYSRKWCAVEITTAWKYKVPIVVVAPVFQSSDGEKRYITELDGDFQDSHGVEVFKTPTDKTATTNTYALERTSATLEKSRWCEQDVAEFKELGIEANDIKNAYRYVNSLTRIEYPIDLEDDFLWESTEKIIQKGGCTLMPLKWAPDSEQGKVIIVCDRKSLQQTAAARILHFMFQQAGLVSVLANGNLEIDALKNTDKVALVVLFSKRLAYNASAVGTMVDAERKGVQSVPVRALQGFPNLESTWLSQLKAGRGFTGEEWSEVRRHAPGATGDEVIESIQKLFKIIAWRFSPDDPASQMRSEFQRILGRVETAFYKDLRTKSKESRLSSKGSGTPNRQYS